MYTDTDSLLYYFTVPNIYEFIKRDLYKFDTSDYPVNNVYGIPQANKKVLGLMKDENNGKIMHEFVGLRLKLYSFRLLSNTTNDKLSIIKKAKGEKGSALRTITFKDYKKCLVEHCVIQRSQHLIQSKKHTVNTIIQNKIAVSSYDDKRILLTDTTDTIPWGYKIKTSEIS